MTSLQFEAFLPSQILKKLSQDDMGSIAILRKWGCDNQHAYQGTPGGRSLSIGFGKSTVQDTCTVVELSGR